MLNFQSRSKEIKAGWKSEIKTNDSAILDEEPFNSLHSELLCLVLKHMAIENFPPKLKSDIAFEAYNYFFESDYHTANREQLCINPTLLEMQSNHWFVHHSVCPFNSFLPLSVSELEQDDETGKKVLSSYCQKVLKQYVMRFRLREMNDIQWFFHDCDLLQLCYTLSEKFDVIDCSNLADEVGLANLLNAAGRRLSEELESLLLTDTVFWSTLASTPVRYVEEALGAPFTMLPSMYGLRLNDSFLCGASTRPISTTTISLAWKRTLSYENVRPDLLLSLSECLKRLARKCFVLPNQTSVENCGMKFYTPMTFLFVLQSAAERFGRGYDSFFDLQPCQQFFDPPFELVWRTLHHWTWLTKSSFLNKYLNLNALHLDNVNGHNSKFAGIQLLCACVPFERAWISDYNPASLQSPPIFRLVLVPSKVYRKLNKDQPFDISKCNGAHCVDNLRVVFKKIQGQPTGWIRISFCLIADHGLASTHSAFVLDVQTGLPIIGIGPVGSLHVEPFKERHPFADSDSFLPKELANTSQPSWCVALIETEFQYRVQIGYFSDEKVEGIIELCLGLVLVFIIVKIIVGLTWLTDRQMPCESAHRITLTLARPLNVRPLTIALPYPFDVDSVTAVPDGIGEIQLTLNKAIYEPWPAQFTNPPELSADRLFRRRSVNDELIKLLNIHMQQQFDFDGVLSNKVLIEKLSTLDRLRHLIAGLYELVLKKNHLFITIRCFESETFLTGVENLQDIEPDWYLKIHRPILFDRNDNPVLIISAFDRILALKQITRGEWTEDQILADFQRIFLDEANGNVASIVATSRQECQLFRFLLRFNSTRLSPSQSQIANLPPGKRNPWLATFLSPCYSHQGLSVQEFLGQLFITQKVQSQSSLIVKESALSRHCGHCKRPSDKLKNCARCKVYRYCDVECQRNDWAVHKRICKWIVVKP